MSQAVFILSALALLTFFIRGAVGAGNSTVFNAAFVVVIALDISGGLSLRDGLYWLALANAVGAIAMLVTLRKSLKLERISVLYLAGTIPVSIVFSIVLTRVEGRWLAIVLAIVIVFAGYRMVSRRKLEPAPMETLERWALPAGLASGVIGGLYGMGGPIGLLLFNRATNDPAVFRMRLTIVTSVSNVVRLAALASQGVFTAERMVQASATLPAVAIGLGLGLWAHRFIKPAPFKLALGVLVTLSGLLTLLQETILR